MLGPGARRSAPSRLSAWLLPRALDSQGGSGKTRRLHATPATAITATATATTATATATSTSTTTSCNRRPLASHTTLAIETSCDDTAVAVLRRQGGRTELLFNEREASDNRAYQGVNPMVAVRAHHERLAHLVQRGLAALAEQDVVEQQDGEQGDNGEQQQKNQDKKRANGNSNRKHLLPDLVAVTRGPGIISNLAVGLTMAKGLAVAWDVPFAAVHHMQAHALTPRLASALGLCDAVDFPFVSLLVSGGHTLLVHSVSLTEHRVVASTVDIAVGNLLDQTARVILPPEWIDASPDVMYGRQLHAFAFSSSSSSSSSSLCAAAEAKTEAKTTTESTTESKTPPPTELPPHLLHPALTRTQEMLSLPSGYSWTLDIPFSHNRRIAFCFSAIHSTVHRIAHPDMPLAERRALAQHTLRVAFQHIASRLCIALDDDTALRNAAARLVLSGGVAANPYLAHVLRSTLDARGYSHVRLLPAPPHLCTDNAAMVAWTAVEMYEAGWLSSLYVAPIGRWSLDPAIDRGVLGVDGLLRRRGID